MLTLSLSFSFCEIAATPRVTPDTQKIACDKQRSEPPKVRRKSDVVFSSSTSSINSPAKTRSGKIYKKRSLSPMSTPKSADNRRKPSPNNLKLKLNLLQSDIVKPKCSKRGAKNTTDSGKESSDHAEQIAAKQRMELPPELPSPKLTEPPKLMAKANKRPVSRLRESNSPAAR